jgi:ATP phosphoribosyltransferase
VRVGLPKGRLLPISERVLDALGVERGPSAIYRIPRDDLTIWLLKMRDIPELVAAGELDVGIAPTEWVAECGAGCEVHADLDGYSTRIAVLAPPEGVAALHGNGELRVATEYPKLVRAHFGDRAGGLHLVKVHGSCEALPPEIADVVVDCVETGSTARRHGLEVVESVLECTLHVITRPNAPAAVHELAATVHSRACPPTGNGSQPSTVADGHAPGSGRVRLHALPPYLRAALLPAVRSDGRIEVDGVGEVALAESRGGLPAYLTVWDRTVKVAVPEGSERALQDGLEAYIAGGRLRSEAPDLFALVVLLSAWDDVIREIGLYPGRVYMASEEATRLLFGLVGTDQPSPAEFEELLLEAQSLELIYRFPVAFKFRRAYGSENQCRLNGWGRRLAQRVLRDPESRPLGDQWAERLRGHLLEHRETYTAHIEHVRSEGLATAPADSWTAANDLPVPILL